MALIGFTVFRDKILDGTKRQTIRKLRKRPIRVGETLHLYWKLRTKDCMPLDDFICTETFFIRLVSSDMIERRERWYVKSGDTVRWLSEEETQDLARRDGFANAFEMVEWFKKTHGDLQEKVFQVIRW